MPGFQVSASHQISAKSKNPTNFIEPLRPENHGKDLIDIGQEKISIDSDGKGGPFLPLVPLGETCQDMQDDLRRKVVGSIKHGIPVHVAMANLDSWILGFFSAFGGGGGGRARAGGGGTWNFPVVMKTQRLLCLF